jgi:ectoine hydroxylase-related dioxygenase (phytanoyl-CoA dioxygenase family)
MAEKIPTLKADASDETALAALEEYGAVIIDDFLSREALHAFNREMDDLLETERGLERDFPNDAIASFFGDAVRHVTGVAGKSKMFVDHVLCHPRYLSICDHVLLPNCADYQLNIAHVMERCPGSEAQFLHRDEWVWKRLPKLSDEVQIASLIALTEFTPENGGTLVVPGSHRWEEGRYPEPHEAVAVGMPAGSAVVYLGSTFHGGGSNRTDAVIRRGIHVSYALGWLRTEENNCLSTPPEVVRGLSPRASELLGFGIHDDLGVGGGYLGVVELAEPWKQLVSDR